MSDPWWQSVRGRVRHWFAHWLRAEPFDGSDFRPRIRFGPESAVTSSPATWLAASQLRSMHPSHGPRDREGEYEQLQAEIARLSHPDDRPPAA
jgi:hypothetical protein